MSEYDDTAMLADCPVCKAIAGTRCMGSRRTDTTHWYLRACHQERNAAGQQVIDTAVEKALDATA